MSLTAPERETVITFSDEDDMATVHTHQRRIITKLKNNPAAELIEDIPLTELPARSLNCPQTYSFRSKNLKGRELSTDERPRGSSSCTGRAQRRPSVASEPDFTTYRSRLETDTPVGGLHPQA